MRPRVAAAGAILALWAGGMAVLAHRQRPGGEAARLAQAALFVSPGAEYYQVSDGARQIGFASSTIDTSATEVRIADFVVANRDTTASGTRKRLAARMTMSLTRTLRLERFRYELGADAGPFAPIGRVLGDSILALTVTGQTGRPERHRIRLDGPLFLPTMVPMVIALGDRPKVGQRYTYDVFDPLTDSTATATIVVRAESLFVLPDSATYDASTKRWTEAHLDSVHAWRIEDTSGGPLTGWIDGAGRMVQAEPVPGVQLRRTAYELAYSNWTHDVAHAAHLAASPHPPSPPTP